MLVHDLLNRLDYVRDRALEIHLAGCRLGFLTASSISFDRRGWERISKAVNPCGRHDAVDFRTDGDWLDPDPISQYSMHCICWSGNRRVVEDLCDWGQYAAILIQKQKEQLPKISALKGYHGTLHSLCLIAMKQPELSHLVSEEVVLASDSLEKSGLVRFGLRLTPELPHVSLITVVSDAVSFAQDVLRLLTGDSKKEEPNELLLQVRLPTGLRHTILLDRSTCLAFVNKRPYKLTPLHIKWIDGLLNANGEFRSLVEVFGFFAAKSLNPTRLRNSLPKELRDLIETTRGKGARLQVEMLESQ